MSRLTRTCEERWPPPLLKAMGFAPEAVAQGPLAPVRPSPKELAKEQGEVQKVQAPWSRLLLQR